MISNVWRKSRRSNPSGNCVEVRIEDDQVLVRDTKLGGSSPVISITRADWLDFTDEIKRGMTGPVGDRIQTLVTGGGWDLINRSQPNVRLSFTIAEWDAFLDGVRDGEFDLK